MSRRATPWLCAAVFVSVMACVDFDDAHKDCVATGRCVDGGDPQDGGLTADGGSGETDAGAQDGGADAGTDGGHGGSTDAGADGGCVPEPISANCSDPWCEVYAAPTGKSLEAIYGFSPTNVWVGGADGFVAQWDGCGWTEHTLDDAPTIWGVWGADPSVIWFVGHKVVDGVDNLVVRRLNPNGLFTRHDPTGIPEGRLYSVSGSSTNDVWMVGTRVGSNALNSVVIRWNGSTLRGLSQFDMPSASTYLFDVWSTGPDEVWISGNFGEVWRWSGGNWQEWAFPGAHYTIWAPNRDVAWVAGSNGHIAYGDGGTAWQEVPSGTAAHLNRLRGFDAQNAWAVGGNGTIAEFNGSTWSAATYPPYSNFNNVWAGSPTDVWVVTNDGKVLHKKN